MNYEVARAHRCELGQVRVTEKAHLTENDVVAGCSSLCQTSGTEHLCYLTLTVTQK